MSANTFVHVSEHNIRRGHILFWDDVNSAEIIRRAWRMAHDKELDPPFTKDDAKRLTERARAIIERMATG